jgi:hypothetical protein
VYTGLTGLALPSKTPYRRDCRTLGIENLDDMVVFVRDDDPVATINADGRRVLELLNRRPVRTERAFQRLAELAKVPPRIDLH